MTASGQIAEAEVVVVGGGPAGSACAAALAERGRDVLIVDQDDFPRDKPCGDGLPAPAVAYLREAGLDDLVDAARPIVGDRMVYEHRHTKRRRYSDFMPAPATARCVTRHELDRRLLEHALAAGARLHKARVTSLVPGERDAFAGVGLSPGDGGDWIQAGHIVAADGATSRLRRECGFTRPRAIDAYAVRTYVKVEKELDPVFEGYIPVEHEGATLPGYGWVFPLDEHRANVGIGYYRGVGLPEVPRLSTLLESFVAQLRIRARKKYGDVEIYGRTLGSPVALSFTPEYCERANVLFVGDAARTTDPYTGEGIGNAMQSGRSVALALDERIRSRNGAGPPTGVLLSRRFPRLLQDPAPTARLGSRAAEEAQAGHDSGFDAMPAAFRRALLATDFEPGVRETPTWRLLDRLDPDGRDLLDELVPRWLDMFRTTFPFTSEMLQRELQSRAGPIVATLALLAARADGAPPSAASAQAAMAAQCLALSRPFLMNVTDEAEWRLAKLSNAVSLLIVDYAVSRGWRLAARLGPPATRELGLAGRRVTEGLMIELQDLYSVERPPERCVEAGRATMGEVAALAAWLGAEAAGIEAPVRDRLRAFALEVGIAVQISEDTCDFFGGERVTGKKPGLDVLNGIYSLPVAYALSRNRRLRRALTRGVKASDLPGLVDHVRETGGLDHARDLCRERVEAACAILEAAPVERPEPLVALARLPLERLDELSAAA